MNRIALGAFGAPLLLAVGLLMTQKPSSGDRMAPERSNDRSTDAGIDGRASVIDGDTIEIHAIRIRLTGIDAPEAQQLCEAHGIQYRCGQRAALALDGLLTGRTLHCDRLGTDRYERTIARCKAGAVDIGQAMVQMGWAVAFRRYSLEYVRDEETARTLGVGLWAGKFDDPSSYRLIRKAKTN